MKYVDEFRDRGHIAGLSDLIEKEASRDYTFMEVCGGHTAAIHRFGIPSLLPPQIRLISGPGCPVCVTPAGYIDNLTLLARDESITIALFGDLMRVPGTLGTPAGARAAGADVRVVLSAHEALETARSNPERKVVFSAIGFETTAPGTAVTVLQADREDIENFFVLTAHKVMPPAMEAILGEGTHIDGFICPGHVAVITGSQAFDFIPRNYGLACVVTGFEPTDILSSVLMLVRQVNDRKPSVEIQYSRAVSSEGNTRAQGYMNEVFEPADVEWRGLGVIPLSGLRLRDRYRRFEAADAFPVQLPVVRETNRCICGDILRGKSIPSDCRLFATACTPDHPEGACMVSDEGSCNTWYKYHFHD
ncbi:MAG: hydrogenase formation protein HypD [Bacteroidales bacterium]